MADSVMTTLRQHPSPFLSIPISRVRLSRSAVSSRAQHCLHSPTLVPTSFVQGIGATRAADAHKGGTACFCYFGERRGFLRSTSILLAPLMPAQIKSNKIPRAGTELLLTAAAMVTNDLFCKRSEWSD